MPLVIDLGVLELAATRFAISPLGETVRGLQVLARGERPAALRNWVVWARAEFARTGLALPTVGPLVLGGPHSFPQFLLPSPRVPQPAVQDELERMCTTRAAQVRASFQRVWGDDQPEAARQVAAAPAAGLRAIAEELQQAHDLLIAPHWPRLQAVLLADIAYRARRLAIGGADLLFRDLHPQVHWAAGRLTLTRHRVTDVISLTERGLVLLPSTLLTTHVQVKGHTTTQTTLCYPSRGAALLWSDAPSRARAAVVELVGAARARVLAGTRSPTTTSALAAEFDITPSAVSQHLGVLRAAGLVHTERAGRRAVHLATERGLALLDDT